MLRPCASHGLGPSGSFFTLPKKSEKASCICNMVLFNYAQGGRVPPLRSLSVDLLVFLQRLQWKNHRDFVPPRYSNFLGDDVILCCIEWQL